jgi:hypothetical protein
MPKAADPIVIPPLSGVDGKFSCIGSGLLFEGHSRETPETLRSLLAPGPGSAQAITDRARYACLTLRTGDIANEIVPLLDKAKVLVDSPGSSL